MKKHLGHMHPNHVPVHGDSNTEYNEYYNGLSKKVRFCMFKVHSLIDNDSIIDSFGTPFIYRQLWAWQV